MSGVTKHIYDREVIDINIMWNSQLKKIEKVLPCTYNEDTIIDLLKKHYPHEWKSVEYKKQYYDQKDKYLIKRFGKARYKNKIARIDTKISNAKAKTQMVTPVFLDQLIGLYNRINTSQKDRMYIIHELKKYYNPKVIKFFFKLNDIELNKQLREIAFYHLQSFNYQPRLRRQKYMQVYTKRKKRKEYLKKVYPYETYSIPHNPDELEYRIENGKEQKIKSYDYFISHSSKDSKLVQDIITYWEEYFL